MKQEENILSSISLSLHLLLFSPFLFPVNPSHSPYYSRTATFGAFIEYPTLMNDGMMTISKAIDKQLTAIHDRLKMSGSFFTMVQQHPTPSRCCKNPWGHNSPSWLTSW